jgi:hypothetical protein
MSNNEEESRGPEEGLSEDAFVEKLVPDPSQPPTPTVVLEGLLGKSASEGYWRLYLTSKLNRYAEFREEDVLHREPIPKEQPPLVGLEATKVWIRRDAQIQYTRTESRRVQAEFLGGGLTESLRAEMPRQPGPQPTPPVVQPSLLFGCGASRVQVCPSWVDACPTMRGLDCQQSLLDACATGFCAPQTHVEACVSGIVPCGSSLKWCPSWVDACPSRLCASRFGPCIPQTEVEACVSGIVPCQPSIVEPCPA